MYTKSIYGSLSVIFLLSACQQPSQNTDAITAEKVAGAVSCTINGLTVADSTLYAVGGGNDYRPTIVSNLMAPANIPENMVWIPGGEFSMGGVNPVGMGDGGHEKMQDARPVHRVEVDGFFMDAHEVTNEEFEKFVKATGYVTVAEKKTNQRRISYSTGRKPGRGFSRIHASRTGSFARQYVPVVELCEGGRLASSIWTGLYLARQRKISCGAGLLGRCPGLRQMGW